MRVAKINAAAWPGSNKAANYVNYPIKFHHKLRRPKGLALACCDLLLVDMCLQWFGPLVIYSIRKEGSSSS